MFLTLTNEQINKVKEAAHYCAHFQFFGVRLGLAADTAEAVEVFSAMYRNFAALPQQAPHIMCYIQRTAEACDKPIALINDRAYQLFEDELFMSHAHMIIFQQVLDSIDDHMLIHAGVAAREGRGVIISGPSTYGKSTLMLELVSRGYQFLSDEFCPIKLDTFTVSAFPRSIGLRESSPFINRVDKINCFLLKNIGRGEKYLVNCDDLFPDSRGSCCKAEYLILLRNGKSISSSLESSTIDLAMYHDNQAVVDEICGHHGIVLVGNYIESDYVVYRFSIPLQNGLTKTFSDICARYANQIFYQERVTQEEADFTAVPQLRRIARSAASLELLKNLRNRSSCSRLLDAYNGKSSRLLFAIGEFLNRVDCYEMTTGPLIKMADLIEELYQKGYSQP
jgi:hypothetical protein